MLINTIAHNCLSRKTIAKRQAASGRVAAGGSVLTGLEGEVYKFVTIKPFTCSSNKW